jgi:N-glycosylase/DNA lyase
MFNKKQIKIKNRDAILAEGLRDYSLVDTFECGQCFRFMKISPSDSGEINEVGREYPGYVEYMTVVGETVIFVGQRNRDELIFYGVSEREFDEICVPYFALDVDYQKIKNDVLLHTDSDFLKKAAESASGIRILKQDPWETLFSFIISQNNNIPRIKKIIRAISSAYGENLAEKRGISRCPKQCLGYESSGAKLDTGECLECGACYSFPSAEAVYENPEALLPSHPGFRYKYLFDASKKVVLGEISFDEIIKRSSYDFTVSELMKVNGVGEKVASCTSLFAFSNLEAFPIDVWMRRAIDEYFGGELDPKALGPYAGVAQQYIFHYIRILNGI